MQSAGTCLGDHGGAQSHDDALARLRGCGQPCRRPSPLHQCNNKKRPHTHSSTRLGAGTINSCTPGESELQLPHAHARSTGMLCKPHQACRRACTMSHMHAKERGEREGACELRQAVTTPSNQSSRRGARAASRRKRQNKAVTHQAGSQLSAPPAAPAQRQLGSVTASIAAGPAALHRAQQCAVTACCRRIGRAIRALRLRSITQHVHNRSRALARLSLLHDAVH